ncbi:uncharacterized protein LOC133716290 [Rosa rugosa]|uniref:uncharacterized protein LOC133716290 n=1 Tax=Rosa rugosa TaxID=74645 RepID=UPI002B406636|nr:uncharacterized protein LOC133716290 [Rosa rugosa]
MLKVLFWNARGAGSENFRSAIADLVNLHSVDILAICEPRVQFSRAKDALRKIGFSDYRIVEANGFSGGIWLLWNSFKVHVDFIDKSAQSVSVKISIPGKPIWMLTVIYASPTNSVRAALWPYLDKLTEDVNLPSMFIGDFNELISVDDKSCGPFHGRFGGLRDWVNRNALLDMGFQGSRFTWSNNRIKERLDRGLCNCSWRSSFAEAFIQHLPKTRSDHCPILMQLHSNNSVNKDATAFRFQAMWFSHANYDEFVSTTWMGLTGDFSAKINALSKALAQWNKDVFGHLFHRKRKLLARIGGIQKARDRHDNPFLINLESELIQEYETIREQENLFWRQKSRDKWLQGGDRNTRFFHLTTLVRRRKNKIEGLFDKDGNWFTDSASMKNISVDFFVDLFSLKNYEDIRFTIPWLFPAIDQLTLDNICKPVTLVEVKNSLFDIGGLKAPGCDGLNHTIISLIPKIDGPQHMANFQPISLCTTIYKVISKIIVARIRPLMQHLISPNQVDLSKAYDRLRWDFIEMVLYEAQFPQSLLSHLIQSNVDIGSWKPVKASQSGPKISHLFFADDLMLFAEASSIQTCKLKRCLDLFCSLSGQAVNYEKSMIFCSPNTCKRIAVDISKICGSPLTNDLGKYLGMPLIHSRVNKNTYASIFDKIQCRLSSWKSKVLSMAGRLTLVQSVTSAIPNYAMQTARLPLLGGLGIKKTADMNQAMLAKASWRIFQKDSGLWASMYAAKYLHSSNITETSYQPPTDCSSTWRSISHGAELLRKCLKWRMGDGSSINFWLDHWLLPSSLICLALPTADININATINSFWTDEAWNLDLLSSMVPSDIVNKIINIPTGFDNCGCDSLIWGATSNGTFTVKSAYNSSFDFSNPQNSQWAAVWKSNVPPKLKTFMWAALHKKLLTNFQRARRGFTSSSLCPICKADDETLIHLFRDCPRSLAIWNAFLKPGAIFNSFSLDWNGWIAAQLHCQTLIQKNIKWFIMPTCPDKVIWNYAAEWTNANVKLNVDTVYRYIPLAWKKPMDNFYKLNIDGTRSSSTCKIGAGGVIRDHMGNWITGFQVNLGTGEILDAKAWGLFYGLKLAVSLHISHLEVESDSAILVQLMQKAEFSLLPLGSLLKGCSNMMDVMENVHLSHIFRECNMTADSLAKESINHELGVIIFENLPVLELGGAPALTFSSFCCFVWAF